MRACIYGTDPGCAGSWSKSGKHVQDLSTKPVHSLFGPKLGRNKQLSSGVASVGVRGMLRCIVLTNGLLATLPAAVAGEMTADEARQFVIGKMFNYACFEGTRGQGRVNSDGSVTGSIQIQGSGPVRSRNCRPTRCRSRRGCLRLPAWPSAPTLLQPRAHERRQLPRIDFGVGLRLLRFYPAWRTDGRGPQRAPFEQRAAAGLASIARGRRMTLRGLLVKTDARACPLLLQ